VASRDAPGGSDDEEAAWRELVAHYDVPAAADAPWPEREDLAGPVQVTGLAPETQREAPEHGPERARGPDPAPGAGRRTAGSAGYEPDPAEEHYVPPPPPPLPRLDPITKGAWLALFGGPAYLLIATAVGWAVSGIAAFCAVAAFVGGFAVLVLRMDGGPPRDSGPDDGAVV
jgi:hypothetical protein